MAIPPSFLETDYVCKPTSFFLSAKEDLINRKIYVIFFVENREAIKWVLNGSLTHFGNKDKLNYTVGGLIKRLMQQTEEEIQEHLDFLAFNVYERLKEVQTKTGKRIWRR
jgi:hypothetical protein